MGSVTVYCASCPRTHPDYLKAAMRCGESPGGGRVKETPSNMKNATPRSAEVLRFAAAQ